MGESILLKKSETAKKSALGIGISQEFPGAVLTLFLEISQKTPNKMRVFLDTPVLALFEPPRDRGRFATLGDRFDTFLGNLTENA